VPAWLEWIDSWYTLQFFSKLVEGAYVHSIARREPRRLPACQMYNVGVKPSESEAQGVGWGTEKADELR